MRFFLVESSLIPLPPNLPIRLWNLEEALTDRGEVIVHFGMGTYNHLLTENRGVGQYLPDCIIERIKMDPTSVVCINIDSIFGVEDYGESEGRGKQDMRALDPTNKYKYLSFLAERARRHIALETLLAHPTIFRTVGENITESDKAKCITYLKTILDRGGIVFIMASIPHIESLWIDDMYNELTQTKQNGHLILLRHGQEPIPLWTCNAQASFYDELMLCAVARKGVGLISKAIAHVKTMHTLSENALLQSARQALKFYVKNHCKELRNATRDEKAANVLEDCINKPMPTLIFDMIGKPLSGSLIRANFNFDIQKSATGYILNKTWPDPFDAANLTPYKHSITADDTFFTLFTAQISNYRQQYILGSLRNLANELSIFELLGP